MKKTLIDLGLDLLIGTGSCFVTMVMTLWLLR